MKGFIKLCNYLAIICQLILSWGVFAMAMAVWDNMDEEIACDLTSQFSHKPFVESNMDLCREIINWKRTSKILRSRYDVTMVGHGLPKEKLGKNGYYVTCGTINGQRVCDSGCGIQFTHNFCGRYECPYCWPITVQRAAMRITERTDKIMPFMRFKDLYHYTISWDPRHGVYEWKYLNKLLSKLQFFEAGITFRHFHRYDSTNDYWFWSPHFHLICNCAWVDAKRLFKKFHVIIKQISHVTDLHGLVLYELGHSGIQNVDNSNLFKDMGIRKNKRQVHYRYWGKFNYRKFHRIDQIKRVRHLCPKCSHTMSDRIIKKMKKKTVNTVIGQVTNAKAVIARRVGAVCSRQVVRSRYVPSSPAWSHVLRDLLAILSVWRNQNNL